MQKPDQTIVSHSSEVGVGGEEKPRRFSFLRASLVVALFVGVDAPASAESDQWIKCQGAGDAARIDACTQVIEHGKREAGRERAAAHFNRGRAYLDKKEFDRAIFDYTSALRLDRRLPAVHGWRAQAYRAKGEPDKALADLDEALKLDPNATQLYIERGETHAEKGDLQRAIEDFSAVIRRSPDLPRAYEKRGLAHFAKHDFDAAIADFDKAIALEPKFVDAFVGRADAFRARGDFSSARRDLETALSLDPGFPSARKSLAELTEPMAESAPPAPAAKPAETTTASRAGQQSMPQLFQTPYRSAAIAIEFPLLLAVLWFLLDRRTKAALANGNREARDEQRDKRVENVSADQLRCLVHEHKKHEEAERAERRQARRKALEKRVKELAARRLGDEQWRNLLAQAREIGGGRHE